MAHFKINYRLIFRIFIILLLIAFACFFPEMVFYLFLAFIMALLGKPVATWLGKIKIGKWKLPDWACASITLLFFLIVIAGMFLLFVPALVKEVYVLKNIDYTTIAHYLKSVFYNLQEFLYSYNLIDPSLSVDTVLKERIGEFINLDFLTNMLMGTITKTGSFFMGIFTVFFVAFFFIKDNFQVADMLRPFVGTHYQERIYQVTGNINHLLTRYCAGSVIRILIMIVLIYIGLALFGIKGALFLSFLGGILNIIPYLGPIIGAVIACIFGFIDVIGTGMYTEIIPVMVKIIVTFIGANIVDNVLLQPYIFSQSVHIHPVEVFLVTIIAGDLAGMMGMIFAIPVYTILRIIIIEIYHYTNNPDRLPIINSQTVHKKK